jgi:hypothetical protein
MTKVKEFWESHPDYAWDRSGTPSEFERNLEVALGAARKQPSDSFAHRLESTGAVKYEAKQSGKTMIAISLAMAASFVFVIFAVNPSAPNDQSLGPDALMTVFQSDVVSVAANSSRFSSNGPETEAESGMVPMPWDDEPSIAEAPKVSVSVTFDAGPFMFVLVKSGNLEFWVGDGETVWLTPGKYQIRVRADQQSAWKPLGTVKIRPNRAYDITLGKRLRVEMSPDPFQTLPPLPTPPLR